MPVQILVFRTLPRGHDRRKEICNALRADHPTEAVKRVRQGRNALVPALPDSFPLKPTIHRRLGSMCLNSLRCNAYPGASFLSTEGRVDKTDF